MNRPLSPLEDSGNAGCATLPLTVVVCTFNRAPRLRDCLESLMDQTEPRESFEVIVVDNGSSDATKEVADSFHSRWKGVRRVVEPVQGLSHARNRGVREAFGSAIAFIDDDARADRDWVRTIIGFYQRHPTVDAVGGLVDPIAPSKHWVPRDLERHDLGEGEFPIMAGPQWLTGTNFSVQRERLCGLGGFDPTLGMMGNRLGYGEEVHLQRRLCLDGGVIYYSSAIRVFHGYTRTDRMLPWAFAATYQKGCQHHRTLLEPPAVGREFRILLKGLALIVRNGLTLERKTIRDRLYGAFREFLYALGRCRSTLALLLTPDDPLWTLAANRLQKDPGGPGGPLPWHTPRRHCPPRKS